MAFLLIEITQSSVEKTNHVSTSERKYPILQGGNPLGLALLWELSVFEGSGLHEVSFFVDLSVVNSGLKNFLSHPPLG